jgi:isoleucyl-tRNA synthetase
MSILLPKTNFAMRGNLATTEPKRLQKWLSWYPQLRQARDGAPCWVLHDGPPYANGAVHLGGALNKILKDVAVKVATLSGNDAPFVPGWDCHGLPIELQVEALHPNETCDATFRQHCRQHAEKHIAQHQITHQRLGILADWPNHYSTMQRSVLCKTLDVLKHFIADERLYKGYRPVFWCVKCHSALADSEVLYAPHETPAIDVAFQLVNDTHAMVIWTTTPWTLPANQAICIHPDVSYALLQHGNRFLWVAEACIPHFSERTHVTPVVLRTQLGRDFQQHHAIHPLDGRHVPILMAEHVTTDMGTGCVHTAPAHGLDDYRVGCHAGLPLTHNVNGDGMFYNIDGLTGKTVWEGNDIIINALNTCHALLSNITLTHSYPHCWRHHQTPLIMRATQQWFIRTKDLAEQVKKQLTTVTWLPEWGMARLASLLTDRPDWCVSRQRRWGTPLALFVHRITQQLHPDMPRLLDRIIARIQVDGPECWFSTTPSDWLSPSDASQYDMVYDVMDVWFDAGATCHSVVPTLNDQAHLVLEGIDQYRCWFQVSSLISMALYQRLPFKMCVSHGFCTDAAGDKMSKSKGNVLSPETIVERFGADVLRWQIASAHFVGDISITENSLQRSADHYRRIRNTLRFLLGNLHGFDRTQHAVTTWLSMDQWLLHQAYRLQKNIIDAYQNYQYVTVCQLIMQFCQNDLSGVYLDIVKDRQYTFPECHPARRSAQTVMDHVLRAMLHWLWPILSFTTDEACDHLTDAPQLYQAIWYNLPVVEHHALPDALWTLKEKVNEAIAAARQNVRANMDVALTMVVPHDTFTTMAPFLKELHHFLMVSSCDTIPGDNLMITVSTNLFQKCERCWYRCPTVQDQLCHRCTQHVQGLFTLREHF